MNINEFMNNAVNFMFSLLIIVLILAVIYAVVWSAIFFPIIKLRKHDKIVHEMEKQYNKIEVEFAQTVKLKESTDEKLRQTLYTLNKNLDQLEKVNLELEKKKVELKTKDKTKKDT